MTDDMQLYQDFLDSPMLQQLIQYNIPPSMRYDVYSYVVHRVPQGHFLAAVISSDLFEACRRADYTNRSHLFNYVNFFHNCAPSHCCGSKYNYESWLAGPRTEKSV